MLSNVKKAYFDSLFDSGAFHISEEAFMLRSGNKSHVYLDHRFYLCEPAHLKCFIANYEERLKNIPGEFQLGIVDSMMSPVIVSSLCYSLGLQFVYTKFEPLTHGLETRVFGKLDLPIVLVDDVTSTGGTLLASAKLLREQGGTVEHALISANRDGTARDNLEQSSITLHQIASFDEILNYLKPKLTSEQLMLL